MQRPSTKKINEFKITKQFLDSNIGAIVNLQLPGEHALCGDGIHRSGFSYEGEEFMENGIFYYNFGFVDMSVPPLSLMLSIVQAMAFHICDRHQKVAVHCHAGYGRTGLAIACYLVYSEAYTPDEAVALVRVRRPGSLQTAAQLAFVERFARYLLEMRRVFPLAGGTHDMKMDAILKRQRAYLAGEESQFYRTVPKLIAELCDSLLETATEEPLITVEAFLEPARESEPPPGQGKTRRPRSRSRSRSRGQSGHRSSTSLLPGYSRNSAEITPGLFLWGAKDDVQLMKLKRRLNADDWLSLEHTGVEYVAQLLLDYLWSLEGPLLPMDVTARPQKKGKSPMQSARSPLMGSKSPQLNTKSPLQSNANSPQLSSGSLLGSSRSPQVPSRGVELNGLEVEGDNTTERLRAIISEIPQSHMDSLDRVFSVLRQVSTEVPEVSFNCLLERMFIALCQQPASLRDQYLPRSHERIRLKVAEVQHSQSTNTQDAEKGKKQQQPHVHVDIAANIKALRELIGRWTELTGLDYQRAWRERVEEEKREADLLKNPSTFDEKMDAPVGLERSDDSFSKLSATTSGTMSKCVSASEIKSTFEVVSNHTILSAITEVLSPSAASTLARDDPASARSVVRLDLIEGAAATPQKPSNPLSATSDGEFKEPLHPAPSSGGSTMLSFPVSPKRQSLQPLSLGSLYAKEWTVQDDGVKVQIVSVLRDLPPERQLLIMDKLSGELRRSIGARPQSPKSSLRSDT